MRIRAAVQAGKWMPSKGMLNRTRRLRPGSITARQKGTTNHRMTGSPTSVDTQARSQRRSDSHRADRATTLRSSAFLVLLWALTQFACMFSPPLLDDVDAIHSEAAREMIVRHDYVTLYVDGIRYLDKPPLPYWLAAGAMHVFGQTDWAIKSTLAAAMLALTLYLYFLGRRLFGERAGFYAAIAIATCIGPFVYTRFFIPDIIVGLWMTVALDAILRMIAAAETRGRATALQACAFALASTAAVLTKGLIGVVFPLGLLLAYLLFTKRLRLLPKLRPVLGTLVFLVTAIPWHVLAAWQNRATGTSRGFLWFYFVNDQINRYLNTRIPRDYDKVPLLLFYALVFVWMLPWGVFLFRAAWRWIAAYRANQRVLDGPVFLLMLWVALIVGFFTFSTRQEYYTLPALPALALLCGLALSRRDLEPRTGRAAYAAIFAGSAVLAATCLAVFAVAKQPEPGVQLWQELQKHPQDYALSFGHLFDFTTSAFGFFRMPLLFMAASLFVPSGIALGLKRRGKTFAANLALALGMCGVLGSVHTGLAVFYPILGSQPLAAALQQKFRPGDRIVVDGEYSNASSVNFYTHQPLSMLNGRVNNLWYGSLYADAPNRFENDASFNALWHSPTRVFFLTHSPQRTDAWTAAQGGTIVGASGGKFVILNHD